MKNVIILVLILLNIVSWIMFSVKAEEVEKNKKVIYFSKVATVTKVRDDNFKRCKEGDSLFTISHGLRTKYNCTDYTIFIDQKPERVEIEVEPSR